MLDIHDDGRVRILTLNRPEALNAFNDALYHACGTALEKAQADDSVACVVITGAGRGFSAGQDLGEMGRLGTIGGEERAQAGLGFPHFLDTLAAFPKPVIAAVNGVGVGIGMTMLLHVDCTFISETARLRAPFVPLGVVTEAASSVLMPLVMGHQRAYEKLYTGEWITAHEAVECGLALRVVGPEELMPAALDLAHRIARMPVAALVATKQLVIAGRIDVVRAARAREDDVFRSMVGAPANV
ncbi:MAG TPA: enoyl-CoA hydratase-related protein, partial [Acidimicrobiia bacterium]|nr:enoyl-CoA hydratase-related protein [Acidimicrobiia bacterium]